MGPTGWRQPFGTKASDNATAVNNIDKNVSSPTIQEGRITKAAVANPPMNAGLKQKSAAQDSSYPCSYPECTDGFSRVKDLKRHKAKVHDWCSVCEIDCEDDVALIEHRKESTMAGEGKHIACLQCGDDFGCEAGRDRHTKLVSRLICCPTRLCHSWGILLTRQMVEGPPRSSGDPLPWLWRDV